MNTVMLVLLGSAVLVSIVAVFHALQDDSQERRSLVRRRQSDRRSRRQAVAVDGRMGPRRINAGRRLWNMRSDSRGEDMYPRTAP